MLNRDVNSGLHFEAIFSPESSKSAADKTKTVSKLYDDIIGLLNALPKSFFFISLVKTMERVEISVEELAESSKLSTVKQFKDYEHRQTIM